MPLRHHRALLGILLAATLLRFAAIPLTHNLGLTSDEREYLFLATRLQQGGPFIDSNGEASARSPLFPAALSLIPGISGDHLLLPLVLESLLGVLAVFLLYRLGLSIWEDSTAALIAAAALALHPGPIIYSALLLTEMPFIVLFLLLALVFRRFQGAPRWLDALVLGVLGGLATLIRGVFLAPFCLIALLLWWSARRAGRCHAHAASFSVIAFLACGIVMSPWIIRNYQLHHAFIPISTQGGTSLIFGNNPFMHGSTKSDPGFETWYLQQFRQHGVEDPKAIQEADRMRINEQIALEYAREHPAQTVQHMMQKAFVLWVYPLSHQQGNVPLKFLLMVADMLLYLGAALGVVAATQSRRPFAVVWTSLLGFTLVHLILHAEARYRMPVVPLVCLLFGGLALALRERDDLKRNPRAVRLGLGLGIGVVGVYLLATLLFLTGNV